MADFKAGEGKHMMSLEHCVVPESKEEPKQKKMGVCHKDAGANLKELPITKDGAI